MISWKFKLWRGIGAAAALSLAACGGEAGEGGAGDGGEAGGSATHGEAGEAAPPPPSPPAASGGEQGEAGIASVYAGVSGDQLTALRLQHLKGFVLVARTVADAGLPAEAGVLIQQGLLEVYDPAANQFGALDIAPLRAAQDGTTPHLAAAAEALESAGSDLTINHADLVVRLVDVSTGLYQHVVQPDFVDPIEYQHSLGAALSARDALHAGRATLRRQNARAYDETSAELERFIALWPAAAAPAQPTPYRELLRQSSRVRLALSPLL
jgi:hypothetical protein